MRERLAELGIFLFETVPGLIAVYLFGSQADGTATLGSDIDIAILITDPLRPEERFKIQEQLADTLHTEVVL